MGASYSSPGGEPATPGGLSDWTHCTSELDVRLLLGGAACTATVLHATPMVEVAWLGLPRLPALFTKPAREGNDKPLHSADDWSAVQEGGETPAGLLPQLAQCKER